MVGISTNNRARYNDIYSSPINTGGFANSGGNSGSSNSSSGSGTIGPQGIQGPMGPQGPQGIPGPQGLQGLTGPAGPAGGVILPSGGSGGSGLAGDGSAGNPLTIKIDPSSTSVLKLTPSGLKLDTSALSVGSGAIAHTLSYDALSSNLALDINGTIKYVTLGGLDDEGVTLIVNSGNLELRNKAGVTISTTPITNIDTQTLTLTGKNLAISNGNTVTLPTINSSLSWNKAAGLSATVDGLVSTKAIGSDIIDKVLGYSASGAVVWGDAPINSSISWNKSGGLSTSVNGMVKTLTINTGTVDRIIGYDATGNVVHDVVPTGGGGSVTSNTFTWKSNTITSTVAGKTGTVTINSGTIVDMIGNDASGNPVYSPLKTAVKDALSAVAITTSTPDPTTDSVVSDTGKKFKIRQAKSTTGIVLDYYVITA